MTLTSIHSLNGRNNSLLPSLWNAAGEDPGEFQGDMQQNVAALVEMLAGRNIEYSNLKNALIPSDKKRQVAFLYDWFEHPQGNYATAFSKFWLPVLRKDIRTSVLSGDLVPDGRPGDHLLNKNVYRADDAPIRWSTQFAVYFSSLAPSDVEALHSSMKASPRYRGYLDVTFAGIERNYLSRTLTFPHVIFKRNIITAHDDDEFVVGDRDPVGYPFAEYGYDLITVHRSLALAFLHYKIEADDSPDSLADLKYSLAAIAGVLLDAKSLEIAVDPKKVGEYLLKDESKLNLMKSIGLESVTADALAAVISDRLRKNYVYDLRAAGDGVTPSFAVSGEFKKPDGSLTRRLIALRYDARKNRIALVSFY